MLMLILALVLLLVEPTRCDDIEAEFHVCANKCTSSDTRERIACKLKCREAMEESFARKMEKDSEDARKKREYEVKKCTSQCPDVAPETEEVGTVDRDDASTGGRYGGESLPEKMGEKRDEL